MVTPSGDKNKKLVDQSTGENKQKSPDQGGEATIQPPKTQTQPQINDKDAGQQGNDTQVTKPTNASTVNDIKEYLDAHNIKYDANAKKDDLLKLIPEDGA
ncbi:HeH/LEM domain-containing protein [Lactobacillus johnsonii]|uniref:HeH/LEM domain-containing protein n=1 Tax=Lactobacillus johnsonii TaxID=33959 RepID=UPI003D1611E4